MDLLKTLANNIINKYTGGNMPAAPILYKQVVPSIVYIEVITDSGQSQYGGGYIHSADGTIVTVAHVVDKASLINIEFENGTKATGTVKLLDPGRDLATVKIDQPAAYPQAKLGNLGLLQIGNKLMAISHPYKQKFSLTTGIVSQLRDQIINPGKFIIKNAIQTDLAADPGSSGGPMFDMSGNVLGVLSFLMSHDGDYAGIVYAIPMSEIKKFVAGH